MDDELLGGWRARVGLARVRLGWTAPALVARRHAGGTSLALQAPTDQLFVATEINEWALCATLVERAPDRSAGLEAGLQAAAIENAVAGQELIPPVIDETAALARFERLAARERSPRLLALLAAAAARALPEVLDDEILTLGVGQRGRDFSLVSLPSIAEVPWDTLGDVPTALVTGSNGKTTTVRLLAACLNAAGYVVGYNCTDGVFVAGSALDRGDYSGPAGARLVLRDRRVQAAVLETARGGILRRGIAVTQARAAVVTNVSSDHFGEYGIDDLTGLADAKLSVASVLLPDGLLVLNADDALLRLSGDALARRLGHCPPIGWFAAADDDPLLVAHRSRYGATCGVRDGRLVLTLAGASVDLGTIVAMPLTIDGSAAYNVANLAAAALAAAALGVAPQTIASVYADFGRAADDNPGRLMRYRIGDVDVLVDYAHNPDGLRGLLGVARHLRRAGGRLGLLLGHAGNRQDVELEALAAVAAAARPDLVVVKENEAHLRGRAAGEIPQILCAALLRAGLPPSALCVRMSEVEAARQALDWARPGDLLVLPLHAAAARAAVLAMLGPDRPDG